MNTSPSLDLLDSLELRMETRSKLSAMKKEIDAQLEEENKLIKADMAWLGVNEYVVGDQMFVLSARDGRATLDKGRLIELGVSTKTIEDATVTGAGYVQLNVRKVKA